MENDDIKVNFISSKRMDGAYERALEANGKWYTKEIRRILIRYTVTMGVLMLPLVGLAWFTASPVVYMGMLFLFLLWAGMMLMNWE